MIYYNSVSSKACIPRLKIFMIQLNHKKCKNEQKYIAIIFFQFRATSQVNLLLPPHEDFQYQSVQESGICFSPRW